MSLVVLQEGEVLIIVLKNSPVFRYHRSVFRMHWWGALLGASASLFSYICDFGSRGHMSKCTLTLQNAVEFIA